MARLPLWNVWQRKPEPETPYKPIMRDGKALELDVYSSRLSADRRITIKMDREGNVTVEHCDMHYDEDTGLTFTEKRETWVPGWSE